MRAERFMVACLCCLLAGTALLVSGCAGDTETKSPGGESGTDTPGSIAAPGMYDLEDGRVEAVGTLLKMELEGGFWAVTDVAMDVQPEPDDTAGVIAVVPNAEEIRPDIEDLLGEYVAVRGKLIEGASIRMAGPEIEADSIEVIGGDTVE